MADPLTLATTHYENFPVGSALLPRLARRPLRLIYAFARVADDLADEARDPVALAAFRAEFAAHLAGTPPPTPMPLLGELVAMIRTRPLPVEPFFDLLDAFAADLQVTRHDRASLLAYCRKSADPIGRLVLRVLGHEEPRLDALSDRICTGLQIVNHLQDVREDWLARDRVYLPAEDLARFGVDLDELGATSTSPGLRATVRTWADYAAALFRDGYPLTTLVRGRFAAELRAILGGAALVLRHLCRIDYDVCATHVRLRRSEKLRAIGGALLRRKMPAEFGVGRAP